MLIRLREEALHGRGCRLTFSLAPWLEACLPKTPNRPSRDMKTANIMPGSFPGIAHIYIKKGGAEDGGWLV